MKPGELAQDIGRTVWSTGEDHLRPLPIRFHVAINTRESLFSVKEVYYVSNWTLSDRPVAGGKSPLTGTSGISNQLLATGASGWRESTSTTDGHP